MSRLRVGDIEIDGSNVRIGGTSVTGAAGAAAVPTAAASRAAQVSPTAVAFFRRIPLSPGALATVGGVLAAFGVVANVVFGVVNDPFGALLQGGILAPVGVGIVAVGAVKRWVLGRPDLQHRAVLGGDPEPFVARVRQLLLQPSSRHTAQWLVANTGWSEEVVLHTLAYMRHRDQISEELDLDTGEFYYVAQLPSAQDLDSRLGKLNP